MKNKPFFIGLTIIVSLLCLYNLSFTFIAHRIEQQATQAALNDQGQLNTAAKQAYLDSLWKRPVYHILGLQHTFQEVKENELNLGLDLQGGIYMVLEVSPSEILRALAGNRANPTFQQALQKAGQAQKTSNEKFTTLFQRAYRELSPQGKLAEVFATSANRGNISLQSSDQAVMTFLDREMEEAVDRSFQIIQNRIDKFGTTSPNIQKLAGTSRIQVELPGVDNPARVRKLLSGVAKLEFVEVWEMSELSPHLMQLNTYLDAHASDPALMALASRVGARSPAAKRIPADSTSRAPKGDSLAPSSLEAQLSAGQDSAATGLDSLRNPSNSLFTQLFVQMPGGIGSRVTDTVQVNRLLAMPAIRGLFPANARFLWDVKSQGQGLEESVELYVVKQKRDGKARLSGEVITDARLDFGQTGQPGVSMQMNMTGAKQWQRLTRETIGKRIAIVLDNYVYSAPVVQGEIPGGNSSISGNFSIEEAKDLANVLKAGKLPAPTRIVEEAVVGPSLGQQAIEQGLVSLVAGLGLIVVLMVGYYGSGGALANVALLANVFFNVGILAQLHSSLTLPGIAGIVLTIGMSVDANVLIYERIREELRNGVSKLKAIGLGFEKAYSSIIDANVTTFIIGLVLYFYGSGSVKGFAITLMIGIICSLFTSVFITRLLVEWLVRGKSDTRLSFDTFLSKNLFQNLKFDFVGKRRIAYAFSLGVIGLGLVSIFLQGGMNLGVDFKGGRSYVVRFSQPVEATQVRSRLTGAFSGSSPEVKTFGSDQQLKITTSYLIDDESAEADKKVEAALLAGLKELGPVSPQVLSSAKVGATIADDIVKTSQVSIVLSLGLIFFYILIRFRKWQYSLGAILALFHDVLFVVSAYAIARWFGIHFEVDQVFIAAVLTIIGYSINDTVVIFDRIREFAGLEMRSPQELTRIVNEGVNATLSRSIMTSLTVLLVVVILLVFGGEVLRGFSFAMLIGVLAGSYSTIFIAAPVVIDFVSKNRPAVAAVGGKAIK